MPGVLGCPPPVAEPDQQVPVDAADQVVGALGPGDLAVTSVIPMNPVWVNITARKTATSSCHHELPSRKNTALRRPAGAG
jgi:hypothetical protein